MSDDELNEDEPWDDEEDFDCYMTKSGQCGAAGSEWCDFDCPFRDTIYAKYFAKPNAR